MTAMEGNRGNTTPYRPFFIDDDEKGVPSDGTQPVGEPKYVRDTKVSPDSYLEYKAECSGLRLQSPYIYELTKRLGPTTHVIQFHSNFSLDSVPDEWRKKDGSMLWKVETDDFTGYVTDSEKNVFYFPDKSNSAMFIRKMQGEDSSGPSLEEVAKQRDNLRKLLW